MDAVYHWVGFAVVHAAWVFAVLVVFYFLAALAAALWQKFEYSPQGNRWFWVKDLWHYLRTGRARWQDKLTASATRDMLAGWNNRRSHMNRFRRIAPYRRNLLAWIVRRQRAAGVLTNTLLRRALP